MPVERNWHEQTLLDDLAEPLAKGDVEIVSYIEPLFIRFPSVYPVEMEHVMWHLVPGVQSFTAKWRNPNGSQLVESATELRSFWDKVRRDSGIGDDARVIVVGDSLIGFALKLSIVTLNRYLVAIFSVPHNTYVFPDDMSWCLNYAFFEDGAYFAKAPPAGLVPSKRRWR